MSEDIMNQRLWIMNDAGFYNMAKRALKAFPSVEAAAKALLEDLQFLDEYTPDGAPWTYEGVFSAVKAVSDLNCFSC